MSVARKLQPSHLRVVGRKNYINEQAQQPPRTGVLFTEFVEQTIQRKSRRNGASYKKAYKTLIGHVQTFAAINQCEIFTNSVNELFLDDFILYLEALDLSKNYICHLVQLTKSMVGTASQYNYAIDPTYNDVEYDNEVPQSVYLTMNEITRIYYFLGLTKKQEAIRDLFVVGCLTGLRYSDYSTLESANFDRDFIVKITKKTRTKVTIPLHDYVKEIYNKYDGEISRGLSIQHFNRYIKVICKRVGIAEPVKQSSTRGGRIVTVTKPKYELVSSHTARRSAATNMYLTGRMKTYEIMAITGHNTERSFFRYIKVTQEDTVKQIAADNFFKR